MRASLPPLLVLTDRRAAAARGRDLLQVVGAAVAGGARAVLLREKDLPRAQRVRLATDLLTVLGPVGGRLLIASDPGIAMEVGSAWVHLSATDPIPAGRRLNWGRSCHDSAGVAAAFEQGAAHVTVSPVFPSPSKPGYGPPLGADGLTGAVLAAPGLMVYALGGVDHSRVGECLRAGATGVAVMGAVMDSDAPEADAARLLAALADAAGVQSGDPHARRTSRAVRT